MNREKIQKEAKLILDKFASALGKVKIKEKKTKKAVGGFRSEGEEGDVCDNDFRARMFENAPNKDGNCIIAEKKSW